MARALTISVLAVVLLFPVYLIVTGSVQPLKIVLTMPPRLIPWELTSENYELLLDGAKAGRWVANSLAVVCLTVLAASILSITAGYALSVYTFRSKAFIRGALLSLIIIPGNVLIIPLYTVTRYLGLSGSLLGAALPRSLSILGIFLCSNYISHIPYEMVEAARLDGAGELRIMGLLLPMCAPVLGVVALIYGIQGFQDYLWQMLVLPKAETRTLVVGLILQARKIMIDHNDVGVMMATGTILFFPVFLLYLFTSRIFAQGVTLDGIRG